MHFSEQGQPNKEIDVECLQNTDCLASPIGKKLRRQINLPAINRRYLCPLEG